MGAYCFFQSKPAVNFDKGGRSLTDSSPFGNSSNLFSKNASGGHVHGRLILCLHSNLAFSIHAYPELLFIYSWCSMFCAKIGQ